jgi:ketosteroid isomerase-like protein
MKAYGDRVPLGRRGDAGPGAPDEDRSGGLTRGRLGVNDTAEVIRRFNDAFQTRNHTLLVDIVGDDCVMESIEPAPDGTRYEGYEACLAFWRALATDPGSSFDLEDVVVLGERAVIRWRYRFGEDHGESVRGVNIMHVRDGRIVEALGYAKSGAPAVADALSSTRDV